ncbi:hypothetical protein ACU610_00060 [Geodermatophilus sp. URMC 61]|uniref:hypothetical protein n=1 Tax=Geodermatophilus sp. URMC 61 TaxID=3423411 RepID=UPI00406BE3B8
MTPTPTPTPEDGSTLARVERFLGNVASVAAPFTLVTALLFYFGYAASRAQYRYFGVDVDTIGLGTQDYVMRSPQVLLGPLLVLLASGALGVAVDAAVRRQIAAVFDRHPGVAEATVVESSRYLQGIQQVTRLLNVAGYCVLAASAALLATYPALRNWAAYPLVTPLLLALGSALSGYGHRLAGLLHPRDRSRGMTVVAMWLVLTVSLFWATATVAEASGRGIARDTAQHLDRLPGVILDTTERLYLTSPGIEETALAVEADQRFRYRYRQLRLLIQGPERLFLVPGTWSASNSTLVIPMDDDSVRVQFRFVNDPP